MHGSAFPDFLEAVRRYRTGGELPGREVKLLIEVDERDRLV